MFVIPFPFSPFYFSFFSSYSPFFLLFLFLPSLSTSPPYPSPPSFRHHHLCIAPLLPHGVRTRQSGGLLRARRPASAFACRRVRAHPPAYSVSGLLRSRPPVGLLRVRPPPRPSTGRPASCASARRPVPPPQCNGWKGGCGAAGGAAFFQLRPGQTVLESASPGRFSPRAVPPGITSQQTAPGAAGEVVPNAP